MIESKMKYNFCYKYYQLKAPDIDIIIELNYDNTYGSGTFGARTSTLFKDAEGDLGHAAGVGKTEDTAIKKCLQEISEASQSKQAYNLNKLKEPLTVTVSDLKEINLPGRVTFVLGNNNYTTVYFKQEAKDLIVLTDKTKFVTPIMNNVIETLENNLKQIKQSDDKRFTKEYLEQNDFYPVFNCLTK